MMLSSHQKGAIAESAIVHAAAKLGIGVSKPVSDGERYDLVFDLRPGLIRVQCKWAVNRGNVVVVRCHSSGRSHGGFVKRSYTCDDIDAIAAYCEQLNRVYLLPVELFGGRSYVQLRLVEPRNNQRLRVNWADRFEFGSLHLREILGP